MTRFLVRCASVAISASVLAVGAGRADARDANEGRDAESKNMKLVGFNDLQARSAYQPIVHEQGGRSIAYVGHHGGEALNPLTNAVEKNGTSIVTSPTRGTRSTSSTSPAHRASARRAAHRWFAPVAQRSSRTPT